MKSMRSKIESGDVSYEDLSLVGQEIAGMIGIPATLKLIEKYKGRNVYIPATPTADMDLVELLGMSAVERLCESFGSDCIAIPKEMRLQRKLRNLTLIKRRKAGVTGGQLAEEFDLTQRHVWQILSEYKLTKE